MPVPARAFYLDQPSQYMDLSLWWVLPLVQLAPDVLLFFTFSSNPENSLNLRSGFCSKARAFEAIIMYWRSRFAYYEIYVGSAMPETQNQEQKAVST